MSRSRFLLVSLVLLFHYTIRQGGGHVYYEFSGQKDS